MRKGRFPGALPYVHRPLSGDEPLEVDAVFVGQLGFEVIRNTSAFLVFSIASFSCYIKGNVVSLRASINKSTLQCSDRNHKHSVRSPVCSIGQTADHTQNRRRHTSGSLNAFAD